jgi:hypothetical protein
MSNNGHQTLFFDIGKLVNQLNSVAFEGKIELDGFSDLTTGKSLYDIIERHTPEKRVRCNIYNPPELVICHPFNSKGKIGHIEVITGLIDKGRDDSPIYEQLIIKINKPIELKRNHNPLLPKCFILHTYAMDGQGNRVVDDREDYNLKIPLIPRAADFKQVLPPETYLKA